MFDFAGDYQQREKIIPSKNQLNLIYMKQFESLKNNKDIAKSRAQMKKPSGSRPTD